MKEKCKLLQNAGKNADSSTTKKEDKKDVLKETAKLPEAQTKTEAALVVVIIK
jgi:hypothetical protein